MQYTDEVSIEVRRLANEHLRWNPSEVQVGRIIALANSHAHLAATLGRVYRQSRSVPVGAKSEKGEAAVSDGTEQVTETVEEAKQRYLTAMHAMQTGVATKMALDPSETEPKNLRVGVNSAMMQQGALVKLLINKGLITEAEWFSIMADGAEHEAKLYERDLSQITGTKITLH